MSKYKISLNSFLIIALFFNLMILNVDAQYPVIVKIGTIPKIVDATFVPTNEDRYWDDVNPKPWFNVGYIKVNVQNVGDDPMGVISVNISNGKFKYFYRQSYYSNMIPTVTLPPNEVGTIIFDVQLYTEGIKPGDIVTENPTIIASNWNTNEDRKVLYGVNFEVPVQQKKSPGKSLNFDFGYSVIGLILALFIMLQKRVK